MSKSLLQHLYDGEIYPAENILPKTPEYRKLTHEISDETHYFKDKLSPDDWKRFEKLKDMEDERTSAYIFENFAYGFRLSMGLTIEALLNDGGLVRNND